VYDIFEQTDDDDDDDCDYDDHCITLHSDPLLPSPEITICPSRIFLYLFQLSLPRCMECRRGLAMRIMSVRLSVTRVNCDKTVERSVQIYIPYERTFSLDF